MRWMIVWYPYADCSARCVDPLFVCAIFHFIHIWYLLWPKKVTSWIIISTIKEPPTPPTHHIICFTENFHCFLLRPSSIILSNATLWLLFDINRCSYSQSGFSIKMTHFNRTKLEQNMWKKRNANSFLKYVCTRLIHTEMHPIHWLIHRPQFPMIFYSYRFLSLLLANAGTRV